MISSERPVYLLGVGGMGMCPLALYLVGRGYRVYGSDDHMQPEVAALLERGGVCLSGDMGDAGVLIYSNAVREDHPVRVRARELGIAEVRRGEALAEILAGQKVIAVVGSHGKTSVTGLLIHLFESAGVGVSYLLGALYQDKGRVPGLYAGEGAYTVVEVDESDGSIEGFEPELTLCVNFDHDHHARYETEGALLETFRRLFARTRGGVIVPSGCGRLGSIVPEGCGYFEVSEAGFIQTNQNAALAVMEHLGVCVSAGMLEGVPGIDRRMEVLYEGEGVRIMHDYAHHPTEIRALLKELGPCTVVFEPHRYTRTAALAGEFAEALALADSVYLLPVYGAFEGAVEGGGSDAIAEALGSAGKVQLIDTEELPEVEGGLLVFIGAGTVGGYARDYALGYAFREMGDGLAAGSVVREWEPLAKKTTLRAGGEARFYVEPVGVEDLQAVLRFASGYGLEVFMLGRGSNLIVSDGGYGGVVVRLSGEGFKEVKVDAEAGVIDVGAGVRLKEVCGLARKAGLKGFEFLEGIPGAVGGALRMNAGAMGGWMFDVVESVQYINSLGELIEVRGEELETGYRSCEALKGGGIAVGARLRALEVGVEVEEIDGVLEGYARRRKESQPREPSSGCIFKNPEGNYAGKLIEEAGCKGMRVGGAEVSEVHGNFIINRGGACAGDVLELAKRVRGVVHAASGVWLEPEVLLLGERWERVLES